VLRLLRCAAAGYKRVAGTLGVSKTSAPLYTSIRSQSLSSTRKPKLCRTFLKFHCQRALSLPGAQWIVFSTKRSLASHEVQEFRFRSAWLTPLVIRPSTKRLSGFHGVRGFRFRSAWLTPSVIRLSTKRLSVFHGVRGFRFRSAFQSPKRKSVDVGKILCFTPTARELRRVCS